VRVAFTSGDFFCRAAKSFEAFANGIDNRHEPVLVFATTVSLTGCSFSLGHRRLRAARSS
jgi:hypothetical protein